MRKVNNIAAIATGLSPAGISIIRVSGDTAIEEVNKIFKGKNLNDVAPYTLSYGHIVDNERIIDEVLIGIMHAPHSYTGENTVEINCHGGILITKHILKLLLTLEIKLAEPGEFSKRAFLNGKKSFEQVTQIKDLIAAKNETALALSINTFNNSTQQLIEDLRSNLMDIITTIEVNIDYPEYEDLEQLTTNKLLRDVNKFKSSIVQIIDDSKRGSLFKAGVNVAIVGSPNVGKSSLLNYLSAEDKAIVTNIAGTTRDIVENQINLKGLTLNLLDTAGIRDTNDVVEQIGVEKSYDQIENAELILFVVDSTKQLTNFELELYDKIKLKNHIVILNKIDLGLSVNEDLFSSSIKMSIVQKTGIDELEDKILNILDLNKFDVTTAKVINNIADLEKLNNVHKLLCNVEEDLKLAIPIDTIEIDLKEALFILGDILGIEVKSDLLNELFSRFCLGK